MICPIELYPLDLGPIADSVTRTGNVVLIEEGQAFAAWGSEVIAQLHEELEDKQFRSRRLNASECPIPSSKPLEQAVLPGEESLVACVRKLLSDV